MTSNNDTGRFGEIANQGGVVVNTQHDTQDITNRLNVRPSDAFIYQGASATVDNATTRVDINDLVFTVGNGKSGRRGMTNNAIPVASNCNGLYIHKNIRNKKPVRDENDEDEVNQLLSETIRFIGQAIGGSNPLPEHEEHLKLNFTTRVQGTGHIINTGTETFVPGEVICWDLFKKSDIETNGKINDSWKNKFARYGYSLKKVPLKLVKMSSAHTSFESAIYKEIPNRAKPVGARGPQMSSAQGEFANGVIDFVTDFLFINSAAAGATVQDMKDNRASEDAALVFEGADKELLQAAVGDLVSKIAYVINDLERRRVGKALSFSKPGKGLDVLLGA